MGTPAKRDRNVGIIKAYEAGSSLRTIATEHGVSHERIRQILEASNVKMRKRGNGEKA